MSRSGFSSTRLRRLRNALARHVDGGCMPGLVALVSRRGETRVEALGTLAFGSRAPMRRDTIFRIASMTKPITAVAAMILVEECVLQLDEPVDPLLPELADRKVLKRVDAALDDTVPATRPISLRDLLTFRAGFGYVLAPPDRFPIQKAIKAAELEPGPDPSALSPDTFMARLGALPLVHQPGDGWLYHTASDVLGVLIARASGKSFESFLHERVLAPLGMNDTGFFVPEDRAARLPTEYVGNPETGAADVYDDPRDSRWTRPPVFQSGGGGLVSTVDDYFTFCRMLLDKGRIGDERILSRPSVELMTTDQLTPAQAAAGGIILGENRGWGFGLAVVKKRDDVSSVPGRFGWDGGLGTSGWADPTEDLVGILMTQRMMDSPAPPRVSLDFWTSAYQAIDD